MTGNISDILVKTHYYSEFTPVSPITSLLALVTKVALKALSCCFSDIENSNHLTRYLKEISYISLAISLVPVVGFIANAVMGYLNYKKAAELFASAEKKEKAKSPVEAFGLYKQAADLGHVKAMEKVGECYQSGSGTNPNTIAAFKWYQKSSDWGNMSALYQLGDCYLVGKGTSSDVKAAIKCFKEAAVRGEPKAMNALAHCYMSGIDGDHIDPKEGFQWHKKAAECGNIDSMHSTGQCLLDGIGTDKDGKGAVIWFHKAAAKGNVRAMEELIDCHERGIGIDEKAVELFAAADKKEKAGLSGEAFSLYRKAADLSHAKAMEKVGEYYRDGVVTKQNPEEAFKWFQKSSDWGNMSALFCLGKCHLEGFGTKKDPQAAVNCFGRASERNEPRAMKALADCYSKGVGVEKQDKSEAFRLYEKAAEKGNASSMYAYGTCLLNGVGTTKNEKEAVVWFQKAASLGDEEGLNALIDCCEKEIGVDPQAIEFFKLADKTERAMDTEDDKAECKKLLDKAVYLYQQSAALGYTKSMDTLAQINLLLKNDQEAFKWFKKSAEWGSVSSIFSLGQYYRDGIGTEKDVKAAITCFKKAVKRGHVESMKALGDCYSQDPAESYKWYKMAADQGDVESMNIVANCHEKGIGIIQDPLEAFKWHKKAAEKGNVSSMYRYGHCLLNGIGTIKNEKEAVIWLQKAKDKGNEEAINLLADCYMQGIGFDKKDPAQAFSLYTLSAEKGNLNGMYHYAHCLWNGIGTTSDTDTAFAYYLKAVEGKHAQATYEVGKLYEAAKQKTEAASYIEKAAHLNHIDAILQISYYYRDGVGVDKNRKTAAEWLQKGVDLCSPRAMIYLARMYLNGGFEDKGKDDAIKLLILAGENKYPRGWHILAEYYEKGDEIDKDPIKAFEFYSKAAKAGYGPSIEKVGDCYYYGFGMDKPDYSLAMQSWFSAISKGEVSAMLKVAKGYEDTCKKAVTLDWVEAGKWYCLAAKVYEKEGKLKDAEIWYRKSATMKGPWSVDAKTRVEAFDEEIRKKHQAQLLQLDVENQPKTNIIENEVKEQVIDEMVKEETESQPLPPPVETPSNPDIIENEVKEQGEIPTDQVANLPEGEL